MKSFEKKIILACGYTVLFWNLFAICSAKDVNSLNYIEIAPTPSAPVVDGVLRDKAWSYATAVTGFSTLAECHEQATDQTDVFITYDNNNLYVSFESVLVGRSPTAMKRDRDSDVWVDECVEIYLVPPGLKEGQFYHFIGNAVGSIYDSFTGGDESKWNGNWQFNTYRSDFAWRAEISIPFADLKVANPKSGTWRANFCRSYSQLTAWSKTNRYANSDNFAVIKFVDRPDIINKITRIQGLKYGEFNIKGSLFNPGEQMQKASLFINVADVSKEIQLIRKEYEVKAGQTITYNFDRVLTDNKLNTLEVNVSSPKGVFYRLLCPFKLEERKIIELVSNPESDVTVVADFLGLAAKYKSVNIQMKFSGKTDIQKTILIENVPTDQKRFIRQNIDELKPEHYIVAIDVIDPNSAAVIKSLQLNYNKQAVPEWYAVGKTIGLENKVLPPWTPMSLKDAAISVWGREYVLSDGSGFLFKQISSLGQELLAKPLTLALTVDNKKSAIQLKDRKINFQSATQIGWTDTYKISSGSIVCECVAEYDGMVKIEMAIVPEKPIVINRLSLEMPSAGKYCHYSRDYYGATVSGPVPAKGVKTDFWNYLWIGNVKTGLMWFSEGPLNWNYEGEPVSITTKGLIVDFVNSNYKIEHSTKITFGLQSTPVRPLTSGFRALNFVHERFREKAATEKNPLGDLMVKMNVMWYSEGRTEKGKYYFDWDDGSFTSPLAKNLQCLKNLVESPGNDQRVNIFYEYCSGTGPKTIDFDKYSPTWFTMPKEQWDFNVGKAPEKNILYHICYNSSFADMMLYSLQEVVKRTGIDGIYFDGSGGPAACKNELHGCHIAKDAKGKSVDLRPIFATRQFYKRMATMLYDLRGEKAFMLCHTSGSIALPVLSFTQGYLDGESPGRNCAFGGPKITEVTDYDYWLAQTQGASGGLVPMFLIYTDMKNKPLDNAILRSYFAMMLPHGLPLYFASGLFYADAYSCELSTRILKAQKYIDVERADFSGYWENEDDLELAPVNTNTVASYYLNRKENKIMVIVSNRGKNAADAELIFKERFGNLSGKRVFSVSDNFEGIIGEQNRIKLKVQAEDFVVLVVLDPTAASELIKHPSLAKIAEK